MTKLTFLYAVYVAEVVGGTSPFVWSVEKDEKTAQDVAEKLRRQIYKETAAYYDVWVRRLVREVEKR